MYNHMLIKYVMDDHAPLKRKRTVKTCAFHELEVKKGVS